LFTTVSTTETATGVLRRKLHSNVNTVECRRMGSIEGNVQDEPTTEIHKTQSAEGATKADTTEKVTDYAENSGIASGKTK